MFCLSRFYLLLVHSVVWHMRLKKPTQDIAKDVVAGLQRVQSAPNHVHKMTEEGRLL